MTCNRCGDFTGGYVPLCDECAEIINRPKPKRTLSQYVLDPALPDYVRDLNLLRAYGNEIERIDRITNFIKTVRELAAAPGGE